MYVVIYSGQVNWLEKEPLVITGLSYVSIVYNQ